MLEQLGERKASEIVLKAIAEVLRERKVLTPDLGGSSKTSDVGDEIAKKVKEISS